VYWFNRRHVDRHQKNSYLQVRAIPIMQLKKRTPKRSRLETLSNWFQESCVKRREREKKARDREYESREKERKGRERERERESTGSTWYVKGSCGKRMKTPAQNETLMTNSLIIPKKKDSFFFLLKGWEVNIIILTKKQSIKDPKRRKRKKSKCQRIEKN